VKKGLPREDLQRVLQIVARLVQQHVTETAAHDHAEHAPEQQIVDVLHADTTPGLARAHAPQPAEQQKTDQVHQAVPAHGEGSDPEGDRVEIGMYEHRGRLASRIRAL